MSNTKKEITFISFQENFILVLVMGLIILNYFNISNLPVSIILSLIITINAALLIRTNIKKLKETALL